MMACIDTEKTYTLSFWGISQMIDGLKWEVKAGITNTSIAHFLADWPVHVVMYELERDEECRNGVRKHLESKKRFYFDFLIWSSSIPAVGLPMRYDIMDPLGGGR